MFDKSPSRTLLGRVSLSQPHATWIRNFALDTQRLVKRNDEPRGTWVAFHNGSWFYRTAASMTGTKRPASDSLLPLRSAKVPRTSMEHRLGGNASPSEASGILSRWKLLIQETLHLTRDTLSALVGGTIYLSCSHLVPHTHHPFSPEAI